MTRRFVLAGAGLLAATSAVAQAQDGEALFAQHCAICHANPAPGTDIPTRTAMGALGPDAILASLTEGNMRIQGQPLTPAQRMAIAERVAGRAATAVTNAPAAGLCSANAPLGKLDAGPALERLGAGPPQYALSTRCRRDHCGERREARAQWAFGIPNGRSRARSPRSSAGECSWRASPAWSTRSTRRPAARTGHSKPRPGAHRDLRGSRQARRTRRNAIYFADAQARAYAIDADTGKPIWVARSTITRPRAPPARRRSTTAGSTCRCPACPRRRPPRCPTTSAASSAAASPRSTRRRAESFGRPTRSTCRKPRGKSTTGKQLWGPAGVADLERADDRREAPLDLRGHRQRVRDPAPRTSDAIVAFDLATGKIRWVNQILPDVWILGCAHARRAGKQDRRGQRALEQPELPRGRRARLRLLRVARARRRARTARTCSS